MFAYFGGTYLTLDVLILYLMLDCKPSQLILVEFFFFFFNFRICLQKLLFVLLYSN